MSHRADPRVVTPGRNMTMTMLFAVAALAGCVASVSSITPAISPTGSTRASISPRVSSVPVVRASLPAYGDIVDGFKIGVTVVCSPPVDVDQSVLDRGCSGYPKRAMAALDAREPGHASVVGVATYSDGTQPEPVDYSANAPSPTPAPTPHPGPLVTVFVFTLADGSLRATGVACTGNGPTSSCVGVGTYPT